MDTMVFIFNKFFNFSEQLKARLNLNVDNIDKLSEDELKAQIQISAIYLVKSQYAALDLVF